MIVENDRIVIKSNDGRVLLSSSENEPPFIAEGNKPRLEAAASVTGTGSEGVRSAADGAPAGDAAEAKQAGSSEASASNDLSAPHDLVKNTGRGLEFGLLLREALGSRSGKRLQNIGTVLFLILLSFMLCLTAADTITISHIDPEDFILSDSHILDLQFSRGNEMTDLDWHIPEYTRVYIDWLAEHDQEVYFIPTVSGKLCYKDDTVPQYGSSAMYFSNYSYVPVEILDPESLITGRMPERYDEIVLDRWVLDKALAEPGVVPNIIPNSDYLLGKQIFIEKKDLILTISGICDSGEPSVYVSKLLLFALGNSGDNVVTYSEFIKITGDTSVPEPEPNQCYSLTDNTGSSYIYSKGYFFNTKNGASFKIAEALETPTAEYGLMAKFVIRDDALDDIYRASVADTKKSSLWCRDKAATRQIMDNEPLPENIDGLLNVIITDRYTESNTNYRNAVAKKVSARFIVTLALAVLSVIMLYLLQRSRIVERMELVAVYRLLGLPKRDAVGVFVLESVFQTLKYSLPVILITWGVIELLGISGVSNAIHLPLWGALATLAAILLIRILFAMLPAIRLMLEPPARLAAKHDF